MKPFPLNYGVSPERLREAVENERSSDHLVKELLEQLEKAVRLLEVQAIELAGGVHAFDQESFWRQSYIKDMMKAIRKAEGGGE